MRQDLETAVATGPRGIEGQVRGIRRMLDERRICIGGLAPKAARAAVPRLEAVVLRKLVGSCIAEAFACGDADERRPGVDELVVAVDRMTR